MSALLPLLIVGLVTGSVYAIAALGLVLTFKTSGVFNFAHGAQAAVAAYLMYTFRDQQGLPWPVAAALALLLVGVVGGLILERLAEVLGRVPSSARVVATVGLLVGTQGLLVLVYGATALSFPQFLPDRLLELPGVNVRVSQLIIVALALLLAASLFTFFRRSRLGVAMQAVVDDPELLSLQGIDPVRVRRTSWILGSTFASLSGILLAPLLGLDAVLLTLLVVQAFGAAAIGAFDSLVGTYLGALAIGVAVSTLPSYLGPFSNLATQSVLPFLVLFVVLLVTKPSRLIQRGARAVRLSRPPRPLPHGQSAVALVATFFLLLLVPTFAGTSIGIYTEGLGFLVIFASLGLLVRTSGQVSLCHMTFAAVGAAGFALAVGAGVPWLLAVLFGALAAVPVGAVVAVPAIRLSGVYLAIATFGFGILMQRVLYTSRVLFGETGARSAPRPEVLGTWASSDTGYYYVVLAIALASVAAVLIVRRARLGRLLRGLADSPAALEAHGASTNVTRLFVFCISAFLAGVAGAIIGPVTGTASGSSFDFFTSLVLLAVLAIAGRRPVLAPLMATAIYVVPKLVNSEMVTELSPVLFGVFAIIAAVSRGDVLDTAFGSPRIRQRTAIGPARARTVTAGGGA